MRAGLPTAVESGGGSYFRPIMFSAPMVRKILAGEKNQTRRLVKVNGELPSGAFWDHRGWRPIVRTGAVRWLLADDAPDAIANGIGPSPTPYANVGDHLWVRETWAAPHKFDAHKPSKIPVGTRIHHAATAGLGGPRGLGGLIARPAIFCMQWMSRIELVVERVRIERLQQITEEDAIAEGVSLDVGCPCEGDDEDPGPHVPLCRFTREDWPGETPFGEPDPHRMAFAALWDSLNKDRAPWSSNPYCWVIDFKKVRP